MITADYLRRVLHYDPATGLFTWRERLSNRIAVGQVAGSRHRYGHIQIRVDGQIYKAQRLAWLYMTGEWPDHCVRHDNHDEADNRWSNLRHVTRSGLLVNGIRDRAMNLPRGVCKPHDKRRFKAEIKIDGRSKHLGYFDTAGDAHQAYLTAARALYGDDLPQELKE
jgi:hypothetical protein